MEKLRVIPAKKATEYTSLDERPPGLNSVMRSVIRETAFQKTYIPNSSFTPVHHNKKVRNIHQNIWNSHVLRNGAHEQRWFDKLQDYRNGV
ncbi:hypothetical protein [Paenibacillus sp. TSA_86.1]|uniref:hypothetical protein n=1 Tax=Paenibacillus sp. TSA_86.1 TaxID=3415649 RepID=UPI004045FEEA